MPISWADFWRIVAGIAAVWTLLSVASIGWLLHEASRAPYEPGVEVKHG